MSYNRKTWINRNVEHPYRRTLTDTTSGTSQTVDVTRAEGTITAEGDTFDANTMNNMEGRIADQFSVVDQRTGALTDLDTTDKSSLVAAINEVAQGGGGGGSSTLAGLTDTSISSPTNGQVLKYNSTSSKWENAAESGGGADIHKLTVKFTYNSSTISGVDVTDISYIETVNETGATVTETDIITLLQSGYQCEVMFSPVQSTFNTYVLPMSGYEVNVATPNVDLGYIVCYWNENNGQGGFEIGTFRITIATNGSISINKTFYDYQSEIEEKADIASPAFTGTPTAPTPTAGDDSTKIATTAFIQDAIESATQFKVNEELALTGGIYAGSITGGSKNVYFFIPLPKGTANISNVAVSGNWYIRGVSGHILSNATLASAGTVTPSLVAGGVQILLEMSTAHSTLTNTPLTALAWTNAKLKFT